MLNCTGEDTRTFTEAMLAEGLAPREGMSRACRDPFRRNTRGSGKCNTLDESNTETKKKHRMCNTLDESNTELWTGRARHKL